TRGTTPIYQPIANLSAAKSAYGNIVYRKAPSFLRQAEFYLGEDKFQTAVRAFLKKHEYANAGWEDLVGEFENASGKDLKDWGTAWIKQLGMPVIRVDRFNEKVTGAMPPGFDQHRSPGVTFSQVDEFGRATHWPLKFTALFESATGKKEVETVEFEGALHEKLDSIGFFRDLKDTRVVLPNYGDYGYGIFLLDDKSRDYVLKHIGEEKDPFLKSMMWGALWDSVREAELDPRDYVELVIRQLPTEADETTVASLLGRVSTALNYYLPTDADRVSSPQVSKGSTSDRDCIEPSLTCGLRTRFEAILLDRMQHAATPGQRITFYRAFVANATTEHGRTVLKQMLAVTGTRVNAGAHSCPPDTVCDPNITQTDIANLPLNAHGAKKPVATVPGSDTRATPPLRTKDKFDIVTHLAILGDPDAAKLLADLEKMETSDDAKRYAYAAIAGFPQAASKDKYFHDFLDNKEISESWIEAAIVPFNSIRHSDLSQPYLERALKELPNLKRTRKIFFINNWLAAWLGGQRNQAALDIVNKFLADNPNLDNDLRLKVLENVDVIERAVKIRQKFAH
ncbi:MAG TPA: ERAP1-like C-terminal domain-containing protein, partial [Pyrinomonadaceae bacterium]